MSKAKFLPGLLICSLGLALIGIRLGNPQVKGEVDANNHPYRAAVLPHHLLAQDLINDFFGRLDYIPDKIYVIGPNHPEVGEAPLITNTTAEADLRSLDFARVDDPIVASEHSVAVYRDIVKAAFPASSVIPLVVSAHMTPLQMDQLAKYLSDHATPHTLMICSTDFSHYLLYPQAQARDEETLKLIETRQYAKLMALGNANIDSAKSLILLLKALDLTGSNHLTLLNHSNSARILQNLTLPSTTSYFELAFY